MFGFLKKVFKSAPYWREFKTAKYNFHYVKDVRNEYKRYTTIDRPFHGDCEDFAFTLQRRIGGKVVYVHDYKTNAGHAVLYKDGWIYCNQCSYVYKLEDYTLGKVYLDRELNFTDNVIRREIDNG